MTNLGKPIDSFPTSGALILLVVTRLQKTFSKAIHTGHCEFVAATAVPLYVRSSESWDKKGPGPHSNRHGGDGRGVRPDEHSGKNAT